MLFLDLQPKNNILSCILTAMHFDRHSGRMSHACSNEIIRIFFFNLTVIAPNFELK